MGIFACSLPSMRLFAQHVPQPAGVVVRYGQPDAGRGDRAGPIIVADTDRGGFARGVLVAQPKRRDAGFLLQPREPAAAAFALARL